MACFGACFRACFEPPFGTVSPDSVLADQRGHFSKKLLWAPILFRFGGGIQTEWGREDFSFTNIIRNILNIKIHNKEKKFMKLKILKIYLYLKICASGEQLKGR